MITEKGTLIVGIEYGGKTHKEFELKPQIVGDSIEILEGDNADRAKKNDSFFGLCLLSKQIIKLGDMPVKEITPVLLLTLTEVDFTVMSKAREALEGRLRSFRGGKEEPKEANSGASKAGV